MAPSLEKPPQGGTRANLITLGRLGGVPVTVDISWLLLVGFVTYILRWGVLAGTGGGVAMAVWLIALATALCLALSILAHEAAHAVVCRLFGGRPLGIHMHFLGAEARLDTRGVSLSGLAALTLAGPLANLVIALVGYLLIVNGIGAVSLDAGAVVDIVWQLNFLFAVFNLLPALPLDGGRVVMYGLFLVVPDKRWAERIPGALGVILGGAIILVSLSGGRFGSPYNTLIGIMIGLGGLNAVRHAETLGETASEG